MYFARQSKWAAQDAHVLLPAVHWNRVEDVLRKAGDLLGKVLVTATFR
jgi:predicted dinucleotide-binding enzyme